MDKSNDKYLIPVSLKSLDEEMLFKWKLQGKLGETMAFDATEPSFWIETAEGKRLIRLLSKHGIIRMRIVFSDKPFRYIFITNGLVHNFKR